MSELYKTLIEAFKEIGELKDNQEVVNLTNKELEKIKQNESKLILDTATRILKQHKKAFEELAK